MSQLWRTVLMALVGATAACGGKVAAEQDPDLELECTKGMEGLYALISGELDGAPIATRFDLLGGSGAAQNGAGDFARIWNFAPPGYAIATGVGRSGDEVETSLLFVTPQGPPFDGAILTASARVGVEPFTLVTLSALRRVGWCPGAPIDGALTFAPAVTDCPPESRLPGCARLQGRLGDAKVNEFAVQIFHIHHTETAGVRGVTVGLAHGGLALVDWSPENVAGVIAFPEMSTTKAVLCVEGLADRPTEAGMFHATALTLAGERPGEPISGGLTIRSCLP